MSAVLLGLLAVLSAISGFISNLLKYKLGYKVIGLFATRKFPAAKKQHTYAVLVAARNEETVIGNLIDSIRSQDYPADKVTVFVVADNCTDRTAEIARELGAVCYERFDSEHRTKGYALEYLVECIRRDYGIDAFEGYVIFDADNLLKSDYLSRMNESFDAGEKIVTSYRNTKNFADNWISASYGVHWLRTVRFEHRARSLLRLATRIQGTGFLFAAEVIRDGWHYTSLTEDRAFCADAVANGYRISYNHEAQFYDEQPVSVRVAMRQRIRWSKGHIQAFFESGPKLFRHIFVTGGAANRDTVPTAGKGIRLLKNLRLRVMSLDMLTTIYPRSLVSFFLRWFRCLVRIYLLTVGAWTLTYRSSPSFFRPLFRWLSLDYSPLSTSIVFLILFSVLATFNTYVRNIFVAAYVYIIERKRIQKIPLGKKIWFCLTFPIFDLMMKVSLIVALFSKVEWKPIPHNANIRIEDLQNGTVDNKMKMEHN